jgi:hypothetical protein
MSVQFCQFSLLPDFDLKLVSNQNPAKRIHGKIKGHVLSPWRVVAE